MKTNYRKLLALNLALLLALLLAVPALAADTSPVDSWYMSGDNYNSPVFTVEQSGDYRLEIDNLNPVTPLTILLYDNSFSCLGRGQEGFSCHLTTDAKYQLRSGGEFLGDAHVSLYLVSPSVDSNTAHPSTQTVDVDGKKVEFQCYALKDANGNDTNYIKLRDLADILNGSAAQFQVGWDGNITITTGAAYTKNGTEQNTPFSGQRTYEKTAVKTLVDGKETELDTFQLKDDNGGGYTYYKLRDLGKALGITVDWSGERGIFIETK